MKKRFFLSVSSKDMQVRFERGMDSLLQDIRQGSKQQNWQRIWQAGVILDPLLSEEKLVEAVEGYQKQLPSREEQFWWLLAAWETLQVRYHNDFHQILINAGDHFLDEKQERFKPFIRVKGTLEQQIHYNLLRAAAWRVLGQAHGLKRSKKNWGRSRYCENRFQMIREHLKTLLPKMPNSAPLLSRLLLFDVLERKSPAVQKHFSKDVLEMAIETPFSMAINLPKEREDLRLAVLILRDRFGLRFWPHELVFKAKRPCTQKLPMTLLNLPYRDALINISLLGCGRLNSRKGIAADVTGHHEFRLSLR